jgi:hypothetical protein
MVPDVLRPGEEVVVTALPLYHVFALMVNFITYFSVGADNWLVPNPPDMDAFVEILRRARPSVRRFRRRARERFTPLFVAGAGARTTCPPSPGCLDALQAFGGGCQESHRQPRGGKVAQTRPARKSGYPTCQRPYTQLPPPKPAALARPNRTRQRDPGSQSAQRPVAAPAPSPATLPRRQEPR